MTIMIPVHYDFGVRIWILYVSWIVGNLWRGMGANKRSGGEGDIELFI